MKELQGKESLSPEEQKKLAKCYQHQHKKSIQIKAYLEEKQKMIDEKNIRKIMVVQDFTQVSLPPPLPSFSFYFVLPSLNLSPPIGLSSDDQLPRLNYLYLQLRSESSRQTQEGIQALYCRVANNQE